MKKVLLSLLLVITLVIPVAIPVDAAVRLNKTSLTLTTGKSYSLKLTGTTKKVVWSSNKKTVATVSSAGKVVAKSAGTAIISARQGDKSYNCKVTVKSGKTLKDLQRYLEKKGVVSGNSYELLAAVIEAKRGIGFEDYDVEIYEFDINTKAFKDIVKNNTISIDYLDTPMEVSAINGKFVLYVYDTVKEKDRQIIIDAFMEF